MTRRQELVRNLGAVLAFVAIVGLISKCQGDRWQEKTDAAIARADSALQLSAINAALADAAVQRANVARAERDSFQNAAQRAIDDANRIRAERRRIVPVANQPGAPPTVSDTLVAVERQLENCEQETTALRVAISGDSAALRFATTTEMELRGALALRTESNDSLTTVTIELKKQLASADPPCRILLWGCPSRTTVAVGSAALATLITLNLTR